MSTSEALHRIALDPRQLGSVRITFPEQSGAEDETMDQQIDFAQAFGRLARDGQSEETTKLGGVNVRLVRIKGGGEGRWDSHGNTTETVIVWSGEFTVEFRDRTLHLTSGECCVVPVGAEHRGTSKTGADIVLFQQAT